MTDWEPTRREADRMADRAEAAEQAFRDRAHDAADSGDVARLKRAGKWHPSGIAALANTDNRTTTESETAP